MTSGQEIKIETTDSINLASFLVSWVTVRHEINSVPNSQWTVSVVLHLSKPWLTIPLLLSPNKGHHWKSTLVLSLKSEEKQNKAVHYTALLVRVVCWWWSRASCPQMPVDILGTNCDQCLSTVRCCFTSTETVRLVRTESPGWPPRLSHSSWTLTVVCLWFTPFHRPFWLLGHLQTQTCIPLLLSVSWPCSPRVTPGRYRPQPPLQFPGLPWPVWLRMDHCIAKDNLHCRGSRHCTYLITFTLI